MGMLRCVVIVATFAILTKATERPRSDDVFPTVYISPQAENSPTNGPQEQTPLIAAGQVIPSGNQQQPLPTVNLIGTSTNESQNPSPTHPPVPSTTSSVPAAATTTTTTTTITTTTNKREPGCGHFPSPGECQAAFPRYWYNPKIDQCDCYLFGGCDEDIGSYKTLEECNQKCLPNNKEEGPSCRHVFIDDFSIFSTASTTVTPSTESPAANTKPTTTKQSIYFPANGGPSSDSPQITSSGTSAGSEMKPVNTNPPVEGQNDVVPKL